MYTKKQLIKKLFIDIAMAIIGGLILFGILYYAENEVTVSNQKENFTTKLDMADQKLATYKDTAMTDLYSYHQFSQSKVDVLAYFYQNNPDKMTNLTDMKEQWQLESLFILNPEKKIIYGDGKYTNVVSSTVAPKVSPSDPLTIDDIIYYESPMNNGNYLVAGRKSALFLEKQEETISSKNALRNIKIGLNGFIISVDNKTKQIDYCKVANYNDYDYKDTKMSESFLKTSGHRGWVTFNNASYYAESRIVGDKTLIALADRNDMERNFSKVLMLSLVIYSFIATLIVFYIYFVRTAQIQHYISLMQKLEDDDEDDNIDDQFYDINMYYRIDKKIFKRVQHIFVIGIIMTFGISFYFQSLSLLSSQELRSETKLSDIEKILDESNQNLNDLKQEYNDEYARRIENIAFLIGKDPRMVGDEQLTELANRAQMQTIFIFDKDGKTAHTNAVYKDFVLSNDKNDQSYQFWNIIKGYENTIVQEPRISDTAQKEYVQYIGTKRLDAPGMVQAGMLPQRYEVHVQSATIDHILQNVAVENGGIAMAIDKKTHEFLYYKNVTYIGRDATKYGLTKSALKDGYSGYQTIDNKEYFLTSAENSHYYIYVGAPVSNIMSGRLMMSVILTVASAAIFILIAGLSLLEKTNRDLETDIHQLHPEVQVDINSLGNETHKVQVVQTRWDIDNKIPWKEKTPEQKLKNVFVGIFSVLCVLLVVYILKQQNSYDPNDIISYIIHLKWEKTFSIFSITYIVMIFAEVVLITTLIRKVILIICDNLGARVETIARLLNNFIKYFAVLGMLMYSLNYIGIDSSAILASAGIFTLVVGLGAQNLIKDILAGIFIVFEGEFRVGDIITVESWRGTVLEIGIRATKIQDGSGNIKIINNSLITGVVNMTKQHSYVFLDVGIDYGESLERVENILQDELPLMAEKLPAIEDGPYYRGVTELADSSVNIRIFAECQEADRIQLIRDMNREIKLMFDRHDINIPFPQVVINQPVEYKKASKQESQKAQQFVDEQKLATKGKSSRED